MTHRHRHRRKNKNRTSNFFIFLSVFFLIGIIVNFIGSREQASLQQEYGAEYLSQWNQDMKNRLWGMLPVSQGMLMDSMVRLKGEEGFDPFQRSFCKEGRSFYIQSLDRLNGDISWEDFQDFSETGSCAGEMFAGNFNAGQAEGFSKPSAQNETGQEGFSKGSAQNETGQNAKDGAATITPSGEDPQPPKGGGPSGGSSGGFSGGFSGWSVGGVDGGVFDVASIGGLPALIDFSGAYDDDPPIDGQQDPGDDDQPVPVPEPSTCLLTGTGLFYLLRQTRKFIGSKGFLRSQTQQT